MLPEKFKQKLCCQHGKKKLKKTAKEIKWKKKKMRERTLLKLFYLEDTVVKKWMKEKNISWIDIRKYDMKILITCYSPFCKNDDSH